MRLTTRMLILSAAAAIPASSFAAGTQQPYPSSLAAMPGEAMTETMAPDLHALKYFARKGEHERFQAEMLRIQRLYPGYPIQQRLYLDPAREEKEFWQIFAKGDVSAIEAAIEKKQRREPGWQPSDELSEKLALRQSRDVTMQAYHSGEWAEVLAMTDRNPALVNDQDIELLWAIAESFYRTGADDKGLTAYKAALAAADNPRETSATLLKAALVIPRQTLVALYRHTTASTAGMMDLDAIEDGFARGLIIRASQDGIATPPELEEVLPAYFKRALNRRDPEELMGIGWSLYRQGHYHQAASWFAAVSDQERHPKAVEGQIHALREDGKRQKAFELAEKWAGLNPEIALAYISLAAEQLLAPDKQGPGQEFLNRFAALTVEHNSGEGSEALGWYAFRLKQYPSASAWFGNALEWNPSETAVQGLILGAAAQSDHEAAEKIRARYAVEFPKILTFTIPASRHVASTGQRVVGKVRRKALAPTLSARMAKAYRAGNYQQCASLFQTLESRRKAGPNDYQMFGWCLMKLDRPTEAQQAFRTATLKGGKGKSASAYGETLAALRRGHTDGAMLVANRNSMSAKQRRTVDIELLTQRARASFDQGDYQSTLYSLNERRKLTEETRDLSLLRGWAHYHRGDRAEARQIFQTVDSIYSTLESRRALSAARRAYEQSGNR